MRLAWFCFNALGTGLMRLNAMAIGGGQMEDGMVLNLAYGYVAFTTRLPSPVKA